MDPTTAESPVIRPSLVVAVVMAASTLLVYVPFLGDMSVVYRYWDGPHYVYLAKTLYHVSEGQPFADYGVTAAYYALHFPLYPLLIRACSLLTLGDFPAAMILATLLSSIGAALLFHRVLIEYRLVASPLWSAILFCFLPPRWIIYHAVGASEPLFLCCVFASLLALKRDLPVAVAGFVVLATLTRITGALLLPAFGLTYLWRRDWRSLAYLPLGAGGLVALALFHHVAFGSALTYFDEQVAARGLVQSVPFSFFRLLAGRDDAHWTELHIGTFVLYGLGTLALWPRRPFFFISLMFFLLNSLVWHSDLSRYFLPAAPFALIVGFDPVLSRRSCRPIIALAVFFGYFYAWGFLPHNVVAEPVWREVMDVLRGS